MLIHYPSGTLSVQTDVNSVVKVLRISVMKTMRTNLSAELLSLSTKNKIQSLMLNHLNCVRSWHEADVPTIAANFPRISNPAFWKSRYTSGLLKAGNFAFWAANFTASQ